nr:MAG TPA: hypothetical protein [Caudoviricetes sp.]
MYLLFNIENLFVIFILIHIIANVNMFYLHY